MYIEGTKTKDELEDIFHITNSFYVICRLLSGTRSIEFQCALTSYDSKGYNRQSIFIFGNSNGVPLTALIIMNDAHSFNITGSSCSLIESCTMTDSGVVTITFKNTGYDPMVIMSAQYLS